MSWKPTFSSTSEERWVLEMEKNFQVDENFGKIPTCVFRVPKNLIETKPEAYAPKRIGLGPYHHFEPEFYSKQKQKLAAVKKFLDNDPEKLQNFPNVVEAIIQWELGIRGCYDGYLDLDIRTLAWILAVDGFYLLQYLHNYPRPGMKEIAGDILMLENQIPLDFLASIGPIHQLYNSDFHFASKVDTFCYANSPLQLNQQMAVIEDRTQVHLLHRMYYLIVNNRGIEEAYNVVKYILPTEHFKECVSVQDVTNAAGFLAERGVPGAAEAGHILSLVEKVPWDKITTLFKKQGPEEQNPLVEEIKIPSVSQMIEIAKIKFILTSGGIRDVRFDDQEEQKKFYLPIIILNSASDIILRNLLAYEEVSTEPGSTLELSEYVDLMCGIIDTPKDVSILKNEKIINSELSDEEIAGIFNGISKSTKKTDKKSKIDEAIEGVNKKYDSLYRVKVARFLKKYVPSSFKFLSVLITIAVLVLLILNASCSVLRCGRWFGKTT